MAQAWQRVEEQAREMLKQSVEGLLQAERDRRVSEAKQRGEKVYPLGLHGAEVLDDVVGESGAGAGSPPAAGGAGRDRAGGTL